LAATVWLPTVSVDVSNVACPLVSSETVPRAVAPSVKPTVPVGAPPLPFTVAAKVTGRPRVLGFDVEFSVVVVAVEATLCTTVALLPENKSGSVGTKVAAMEWLPAASEDIVNAARALLSSETFPSTFVPSVKATVPVGVRAELSQNTVAIKITGCP